ncbi:unknown protein [Simkania negevensis Z]|uniref:Uncharacterized protein n=1 Tax=Simkania negevensis (strain ATCC VR-1471 / DSM 27360 / Z) TaxID=331113 RepID=F8L4V6_SIMNZ|nr:unknown protein [Simkania negevensis Z]
MRLSFSVKSISSKLVDAQIHMKLACFNTPLSSLLASLTGSSGTKCSLFYIQTISKIGFGQYLSFRNLPILSNLIFLILDLLRSVNYGALAQPKIQFLKLFEYNILMIIGGGLAIWTNSS